MSVVPLRFSRTEELTFEPPKTEAPKLETTKIEVVPKPESETNENHVGGPVHEVTHGPDPSEPQDKQKPEPVKQAPEQKQEVHQEEPEVQKEEPEVHTEQPEVSTEQAEVTTEQPEVSTEQPEVPQEETEVHSDPTEPNEIETVSKEPERTDHASADVVTKEETSEVESTKPTDEDEATRISEPEKEEPKPSETQFEDVDLTSDKTQLVPDEESNAEPQISNADPSKEELKSGVTGSAQVNPAFQPDEVKKEINGNKPSFVIDLDGVLPAESTWTTIGTEAVKLRMSASGPGAIKPRSVPSVFLETVRRVAGRVALAKKVNNVWKKWTYKQYYLDVRTAAKGFIKLGLQPAHGVGILGFNSPEWFISDIGAIFAGGWAVGIYTTNSPEACQYVAENCEANVIVVENTVQLKKILAIRDNLPHLKAIVQYDGQPETPMPGFLYSWSEFMELGQTVPDSELDERLALIAPNKCCTLVYTSGTTGNPKGVMLSHDNVTWTSKRNTEYANLKYASEVIVSYLPLSHIAAQILDIHMPIAEGSSVYFAQPDALKGSLGATLKEVRPTSFLGVPRVWEKIMEKMQGLSRQTTGIKKKLATWAKGIGLKGNYSKMRGGSTPFGWTIANFLVFRKVRAALGLDRCNMAMSAAAPISKDTLEYFMSLNIVLNEVYGMSESGGPHAVNVNGKCRITSAGMDFPGATTKLRDPDEDGNGEICMYGRHVFMGYLNNEQKTRETLDEEDYLMTGDIGRKDKDGFLYITGRIKELIITAGGENVPPVPIEENVKAELPIVSNCMLIGDKRKFLSLFITLKTEADPDTTAPLDELTDVAKSWCKEQGSEVTKLSEILEQKPDVIYKAIQAGIDRANTKAVSRAQKIQKFVILPRDFSIPGGELGPSLKLKRPVVTKMYANVIEEMYVET